MKIEAENMASSTGVGQFSPQTNSVKRKGEMQMMHCSVCKIILNSSSQADAHFSGKSHRNKAKGLLENGMPLDAITLIPVTSNPQHSKCEICQKNFNSPLQLKSHLLSKNHQLAAQSKVENTLIPGTSTLEPSNPGMLTPGVSSPGALNPGTLTPVTSPNKEAHPVGKNLSDLFTCEKCNITLNSVKQMEQHRKGLRHKIITGEAQPPAVGGEKWENVRYAKISNAILGINKDYVTGSGGGMNIREYHCEKCDITVNSQTQLDQHLESNKHKKRGVNPVPSNGRNKRKHPPTTGQGQEAGQWKKKRSNQKPKPLSNNFVAGDTYFPGGNPVYRLPPVPKPYFSQNYDGALNPPWVASNFGYDPNVTLF